MAGFPAYFAFEQSATVQTRQRASSSGPGDFSEERLAQRLDGLDAEARRALDLARLGYRDPSAAQVVLARRSGVDLAPWSEQPVLPLASGL
jgi:hypothetical protein